MAVQKSFGGGGGGGRSIARGQRVLIWIILSVVCLVLFQFWTYEQTWSPDHPNTHGSRKVLRAMLMKSWFAPEDGDGIDTNPDFRILRDLITVCNSSSGGRESHQERRKTLSGECLMRLQKSFPSLQPPVVPALAEQHESCTNGVDNERLTMLQTEVDLLSDSLRNSTVFLELKDSRESGLTDKDATWFMSSVHGSKKNLGIPEEFEFPSEMSRGRLLCLMGNNQSDGTQNKYGFAWKGYLPPGATFLPGITLVADNYWDYNNIWHAMSALVGFVSWSGRNGCGVPQRVLLYHWGEHVPSMGSWIDKVLHASFGRKLEVEGLEQRGNGEPLVCLERAIVNRRGLGSLSDENMNAMFETIRCKTRQFCDVVMPEAAADPRPTRITLFLRSGARAFKNETAVWSAIDRVCRKVGNCRLEVSYSSNLTFCEQVRDGLASLFASNPFPKSCISFLCSGLSCFPFIPLCLRTCCSSFKGSRFVELKGSVLCSSSSSCDCLISWSSIEGDSFLPS